MFFCMLALIARRPIKPNSTESEADPIWMYRDTSFGSSANTKGRRTRNSPLIAGAARYKLRAARGPAARKEFATNRRVASFE
jgi:hypothetical protein